MQAEPTLNLTTCKFDERPSITHLVRHATTFRESIQSLNISQLILSSHAILSPIKLPEVHNTLYYMMQMRILEQNSLRLSHFTKYVKIQIIPHSKHGPFPVQKSVCHCRSHTVFQVQVWLKSDKNGRQFQWRPTKIYVTGLDNGVFSVR